MNPPSKDNVVDAFFALLAEEDFSKISVSALCKRAGISRWNFSHLFPKKEDVVRAYFERSEFQFLSLHQPLTPYTNSSEFVFACFSLLCQEKDKLLLLNERGLISYLSLALNEGIERDFAECDPADKALAYLYSGAVYNLEVYSLNNGAKETPQELRDLFLRFLKSKKLPS
jgi:AcrR family transcriptional regulator